MGGNVSDSVIQLWLKTMNLNLISPINQLGGGISGFNLYRALVEAGHCVALWPQFTGVMEEHGRRQPAVPLTRHRPLAGATRSSGYLSRLNTSLSAAGRAENSESRPPRMEFSFRARLLSPKD